MSSLHLLPAFLTLVQEIALNESGPQTVSKRLFKEENRGMRSHSMNAVLKQSQRDCSNPDSSSALKRKI